MACVSNGSIAGNAKARRLGLLDAKKSVIFLCDFQERFRKAMDSQEFNLALLNAEKLMKSAKILNVPIIATEQNPQVNKYFIKKS